MKMSMTHATIERNTAVREMSKLKREMEQAQRDIEQVRDDVSVLSTSSTCHQNTAYT